MTRVPPAVAPHADPIVADGFGQRTHGVDPDAGDEVEFLELPAEWVEHTGFVKALGERVVRISTVRHASYAHLRRLDRPSADRLLLVSDLTPGWRLSELLAESETLAAPLDITVVIGLLRQLLPAVELFSRHNRDSAIGTLAPERLIVTPQARLVIAEHAFGPALEKLNLGRDRLWRDLRVAMAPSAGLPHANARADVNAIAVVALSLLIGRLLEREEYPARLQALLDGTSERHEGQTVPLSPALANWLACALQFDARTAFQSPHEAQVGFEAVLASDRGYVTKSAPLEQWVAHVGGALQAKHTNSAANDAPIEAEPPAVARTVEPIEAAPAPAPAEAVSAPVAAEAVSTQVAAADPPAPAPGLQAGPATGVRSPLVVALVAMTVFQSVAVVWLWNREPGAPRAGEGELVVRSRPIAARVSIDGEDRGVTPLMVKLPSGAHVIEVQIGKSEPRVIPITIQAGVQTAQYIELQNVPMTGGLDIRSDPPGARVSIDGRDRGRAPLTIRDLPPGDHDVVLEANGRTVKQVVRIDPGTTAQLVVPMPRR